MGSEVTSILPQLGIGGAIAAVILVIVFGFILKREPKTSKNVNGVSTASRVEAIHELLNEHDSDGAPLIYVPRSLGNAIHELAMAVNEQTKLLERLNNNITECRRDVAELQRRG